MFLEATRSSLRCYWYQNESENVPCPKNFMEQGWDPDVKKFFRKIINTISFGLIWLMTVVTAGLYFKLGYRTDKPVYMIIYYSATLITLFFLLRYYYRIWKKD